MKIAFVCNYCGKTSYKHSGHINRSRSIGAPVYCDRKCAGMGRRSDETPEDKKNIKAIYDLLLRLSITDEDRELHELQRMCYFQYVYSRNPDKFKKIRQERMPKHIEYCRQPKYKNYKQEYDLNYRAKKEYGEFGEAAVVLMKLEREIDVRLAKKQNGIINKSQKRKRLWQKVQAKQTTSSLLAI